MIVCEEKADTKMMRQWIDVATSSYLSTTVFTSFHIICSFLSPEKLQEIAEPQYVPSDDDIANCKERPSSLVESAAVIRDIPFVYVHVYICHIVGTCYGDTCLYTNNH